MSGDLDKTGWLQSYYALLQPSYDYSLKKKDTLTNWSLTILVALIGLYFGIQSEDILDNDLKFLVVTGFLIILIQFFGNSLISYAYLRKWRHLKNSIDKHWMTGKPTHDDIVKDIDTYDINESTPVGITDMILAQLRAGFAIILGGPAIIWTIELLRITTLSQYHVVAFAILAGFIVWEIYTLKTYDKIKKPNNNENTKKNK